jgi:hypothetical protein
VINQDDDALRLSAVKIGDPEFHSFARKLLICRFAEGRFCHNSRLSRAAEAR